MTRFFPIAILLVLLLVMDVRSAIVELEPERGRGAAKIDWTDATNKTHNLSEFSGYPLIVLPIYTRCRSACVQNVARLEQALAASSFDPRQFRVFVFSFDATDSPATLTKYRARESIPLSWSVGSASQAEIDALLDSLGFQVGKAGSEFAHPNLVFFLDANLQLRHWLYGTEYSPAEVDQGLRIASGNSSWLAASSEWLYSILLLACSLLCVAGCYTLIQLKNRRQEKPSAIFAR